MIQLEEVLQRLGMTTERRGATTQALCPFHQHTRPSLEPYPADNASSAHYHCFACGAHGNAIDLVNSAKATPSYRENRTLATKSKTMSTTL